MTQDYYILDDKFQHVSFIDRFKSFIWTDRYYSCGDFEFVTAVNDPVVNYCIPGYYIYRRDSNHMMIIETVEITSNIEDGEAFTVSGRSLESILDRRIVWDKVNFNDAPIHNAIKQLILQAIISPSNQDRLIENFDFIDVDDEYINSKTISEEFIGQTLLEIIEKLCESFDIGFKLTLGDDRRFKFQLYYGKDRSYAQIKNPYVVFSEEFNNIINSNYLESREQVKNVALVEGEENEGVRKTVTIGSASGIDRRELFVDARDISSTLEGGGTMPTAEYTSKITQRGEEKLSEYTEIKTLEGQMETTMSFKYDKDFYMGDIVQVENIYGMKGSARVIEYVWSISESGVEAYPTFKVL